MTGALAWQANTSLNKTLVFVVMEGDGTGLPGSPSICVPVFPSIPLSTLHSQLNLKNTYKYRQSSILQHI
ncbi:hypothetical protein M8C21_020266 [Ambrosia artemisiifolia]|uniref:Uncharacterized protein n=1 Tax=Ambrosia artemisiifolia TaxID=4212 RepID=A0AAD5CXG1_AMBAR|nr:hypothetical protein M8C21_020266 [Ambrosia artemisiifolia]